MDNKDKVILDLAGGSGAWSKPYKNAGYTVYNITLPEWDILETDILKALNFILFRGTEKTGEEKTMVICCKNIYGILFAPTCTHFSLARTRAKTPRDFREAMRLVRKGLEIIWECRYNHKLKFWCIENPRGYLRQFLGKPAMTFDPCDYGDTYTKKTDLWGYFNFPKKKPIKLTEEETARCKINNRKLPSISDITGGKQSAQRAITPAGFANAFFKSNK